ncbi:MAG: LacI family DNA-binding transcriptional regulator, partial [Pseudomonadota bacterium]|nr:LacI family DNA-binding transcriptional regulator [Pseudomonadota bacterium]
MSRPTVNDLAKAAGVSLATVDRVLNARPGVRDQTIRRVNEAIERIGYVRDVTAANLARQRRYRFAFVLPEAPGEFVSLLRAAVTEAAASPIVDRTELTVATVPPDDPHLLVKTLGRLGKAQIDGIAILAPETPHVRDAIAHLKEKGVAVVALVSDLPSTGRDHFVGVDNIAAGRTAGVLMGRFVKENNGCVVVLASSMQARANAERRLGFDQVMAEQFPSLTVTPSLEGHDDPDTIRRVLATALKSRGDMVGIYSVGTGNGVLIDMLAEHERCHELVVIGHELTRNTRRALTSGIFDAVINQNVGHIARSALRVLRAKSDGIDIHSPQERIRIEIILRE